MKLIKAVVIDPVGCLAEFRALEFDEIATSVYGRGLDAVGSEAYWELLDLMERSEKQLSASEKAAIERLEIEDVEVVELYEDVGPALAELKAMGITLLVASSLSSAAVNRFLDRFSLNGFFSGVWTRDNAGGVKVAPLARAIEGASLPPEQVMCLVDTTDGMDAAKQVGAHSILMINDYDEGRRLAMHPPTGGIVSLHELPDAIRLIAEQQLARK